jgi:hypothetical protein
MPDTIPCPQCGKSLALPESVYGTQVQCPICGTVFTAGSPAPPPPRLPLSTDPIRFEGESPRRRDRDYDDRERDRDRDYGRDYDGRDYDDRDHGRRGYEDYGQRRDVAPHRGGAILALGIIGLLVSLCPILGWTLGGIATNMANADLTKMNLGHMDRDGRSQTETGKMLGTIAIVISSIVAVLNCILLVGGRGLR